MQITFHRRGEFGSYCLVRRDDGVTLFVPAAETRRVPPHDLAHYVVESTLARERGFWATVAAGAIFDGMAVREGRLGPHAHERSAALIRANGPYILQAEVIVSALQRVCEQGLDSRPEVAAKQVREAQSAVPVGVYPIQTDELQRTVAALRDAAAAWRALALDGALTVVWLQPVPDRAGVRHNAAGKAARARGRLLPR